MSFISKLQRKKCWDSRNRYWDCLDKNAEDRESCLKLRQAFEDSCPAQWVKHFDRKRDYLKFKARIEKEGYEPLDKIPSPPPVVPRTTSPLQTVTRRHRVYKELMGYREENCKSAEF
ncbi:hypothetical protein L798_03169 [Zootermopsis nevadensis]|uniref:Cytochrome c oxidase assembly factor 6-like protein n=1 Tax=Zootermopsis nevadensis TaxID=136037 RepID=A0A067REC5_ZOONE|nr:hypothetical protein L798_03169 [Zootermopsis nevadensis]